MRWCVPNKSNCCTRGTSSYPPTYTSFCVCDGTLEDTCMHIINCTYGPLFWQERRGELKSLAFVVVGWWRSIGNYYICQLSHLTILRVDILVLHNHEVIHSPPAMARTFCPNHGPDSRAVTSLMREKLTAKLIKWVNIGIRDGRI